MWLTVGVQAEIPQEIIRKSLAEVRPVNLEADKHDADPEHNLEVDLADDFIFFYPGPPSLWVEAMDVFPVVSVRLVFGWNYAPVVLPVIARSVLLRKLRIVVDTWLQTRTQVSGQ